MKNIRKTIVATAGANVEVLESVHSIVYYSCAL